MGGSRVQLNKQHKTRFASKSSRNVHKISSKDKIKPSKPERNVASGAKAARLQRNKMMKEQKRAAVLKEKRESSGQTSPPRVIVLFGLSNSVNLNSLEKDILSLLSGQGNDVSFPAISSSEYKLRATVLKAPHGDLLACMEMAKVADLIAFVASPNTLCEADDADHIIDSFGSQCLSVFRTLGLPSTVVLIRDLPDDLKGKNEQKKMCMSVHVRKGGNIMDLEEINTAQVVRCLTPDPLKQEHLVIENVPDPLAGEQTWPTEAEMAEADRCQEEKKVKKKRLPKGTSEYQAAWIVDDSDIDYSDSNEDGTDGWGHDQVMLI